MINDDFSDQWMHAFNNASEAAFTAQELCGNVALDLFEINEMLQAVFSMPDDTLIEGHTKLEIVRRLSELKNYYEQQILETGRLIEKAADQIYTLENL